MSTVWLVNPHTRGTVGEVAKMANKGKKPRSAAQKEAFKKMIAARKASLAGKGHTPAKPAKKTYAKTKTVAVSHGQGKTVYKRNPLPKNVKRAGGMLQESIIPAAVGAGGALAFDIVWGKLPIPADMRAGSLKFPVKLAGSLALSVAAEHLLPKQHKHYAKTLALGSLTVIMHDAAKEFMAAKYPTLYLGAYEEEELAGLAEVGALADLGETIDQGQPQQLQALGETMQMNTLGGVGDLHNPFWGQNVYEPAVI